MLRALVVAGLLAGAITAHAKGTPGEPRFPTAVSDRLLQDFVVAGRVQEAMPREPDSWLRWGAVPLEHQTSSIRAVVDALSAARPPIGVAAAILAIARVESGWNPYSRNPASTACGLFQFIRATWASYADSQERCFDARLNAAAGVKHLTTIYETRVGPRLAPLIPITTEAERVAWTYRMLYAFHYHGEAVPVANEGGSIETQTVAEAGVPQLQRFFSILKRATAPPVRKVRAPTRRARRVPTKPVPTKSARRAVGIVKVSAAR